MIKHTVRLIVASALLCNVAFAQSVDEGKKFYYYEKYVSAKDALEKAVAAKPDDVEAVYWLGQTLIEMKDTAGAKAVFQKALQAKGSDPLLLVGIGQVELMEKKTNEARQRFETAISLTKGKDIGILNAVGHANAAAAEGDAKYAIEKLTLATQVKKFKDPDVYINLGDAQRKLMDGGAAVTAYQSAFGLDPKLAEAKYKIGKIYVTQGPDQANIFLKNFEEAVTIDPAYAPAYYDMYSYWYSRDVNKARDYFAKYKANTDFTPSVEAEEISLVYASGDFKGAIAKADEKLQKDGDKADVKLYRTKAYAYDKLGDSVNALQNMETFLAKASPDIILPDNYVKMAEISAKFPDKVAQADEYFNKVINMDTVVANKINYAKAASDMYKKLNDRAKSAEWLTKILTYKPDYGKTELFYAGFENFYGEKYATADSIATLYKTKFPDDVQGYYLAFRSKWSADTAALASGIPSVAPVEDAKKLIELAETDKQKYKQSLLVAYGFMAGYYANNLKDYPAAVTYLDKILEVDPGNADAQANKEVLQKAINKPQQKSTAPAPKKAAGAK
ncbi:MAG: tetratricopeptide repeat protein [Agriterribacter sp.]